jgi:hypothetical protein
MMEMEKALESARAASDAAFRRVAAAAEAVADAKHQFMAHGEGFERIKAALDALDEAQSREAKAAVREVHLRRKAEEEKAAEAEAHSGGDFSAAVEQWRQALQARAVADVVLRTALRAAFDA